MQNVVTIYYKIGVRVFLEIGYSHFVIGYDTYHRVIHTHNTNGTNWNSKTPIENVLSIKLVPLVLIIIEQVLNK